uniref:Uncharacterized protein n=1 Tax=Malurus cyaneus samueli TaxID=2593467 RepID=A0A8C5T2V9_9PASS
MESGRVPSWEPSAHQGCARTLGPPGLSWNPRTHQGCPPAPEKPPRSRCDAGDARGAELGWEGSAGFSRAGRNGCSFPGWLWLQRGCKGSFSPCHLYFAAQNAPEGPCR